MFSLEKRSWGITVRRRAPALLVFAPTDVGGVLNTLGIFWGELCDIMGAPGELEIISVSSFKPGKLVGLLRGLFLWLPLESALSWYSWERFILVFSLFDTKSTVFLWIILILGALKWVPLNSKSKEGILLSLPLRSISTVRYENFSSLLLKLSRV